MAVSSLEWQFDVERGPDWLFVRPSAPPADALTQADLADQVWELLDRCFVHRLVLELDRVDKLSSSLIGQLVALQRRIQQHGGLMRICGLNRPCQQVLEIARLNEHLSQCRDREEAVLGPRPLQPR